MAELNCKKPKLCESEPAPAPVPCSEPFSLCVGDRTLKWDGFCLTTDRPRHTPDGTYTSVTVVDGCIVEYGHADEATYTPPYCNPNPTHCQGDSTGAAEFKISNSQDNTLAQTSGGLFARTYIVGGNGVTVSGTGNVTNPYTVSLAQATNTGGTTTVIGRNGIASETTDAGVTYLGLEESGVKTGKYGISDQFTVDKFGRITEVKPREAPLFSAGSGLELTKHGDTTQIGHLTYNIDERMVLGAYVVNVSNTGHITNTQRAITLNGGIYNLGAYNVAINAFGSISSIAQREDVLTSAGTFVTIDGKIISYDITGRLTDVSDSKVNQVNAPALAPLPLRDMYKVTPATGSGAVTKEIYGADTQMTMKEGDVHIMLPAYVVYRGQVAVQGATSWSIESANGMLVVKPDGTKPFTVAFRG